MSRARKSYIEVEEVLVDTQPVTDAAERLEWPPATGRLIALSVLFFAVLAVFVVRVFSLSIVRGNFFSSRAEAARERAFPIIPIRGVIFDRNGASLVANTPGITVYLDPLFLPQNSSERAAIFEELGRALGKSPGDIENAASEHGARADLLEIASGVDAPVAVDLSLQDLPGVRIEQSFVRSVTEPDVFSTIVGYLGAPPQDAALDVAGLRVGQSGVEATYGDILRGSIGQRIAVVDARGHVLSEKIAQESVVGNDLMLSVDADLTRVLYNALENQRKIVQAPAAAAVALDPKSGEILSLVSIPSVNADLLNRGISHKEFQKLIDDPRRPFLNRAVAGLYPSGSTIKPFVAVAALAEKVISPARNIFVSGSITVPSIYDPSVTYTFPDWKAHGWVDMVDAIAVSSNVYFYTVGGGFGDIRGLGVERLDRWLSRFGFGSILRVDLPGEVPGRVPTPQWKEETKQEQWFIGDTYNLSIGQGDFAVTPLQLAAATAAVANRGIVFRPHIAKRVQDPFGGVVEEFGPQEVNRIDASGDAFDTVRLGMRMSVASPKGTNRSMADLPVKVAAKTGTAQAPREKLHAWVTAFAPYEDPQIVLAILIGEGGQGTVATEVAKEVLAWYAENRL